MSHQDKVVFRNFIVVLGVLVAMAVAFFFIAGEIANDELASGSVDEMVAENIRPVGQVRVADEAAPAPAATINIANTQTGITALFRLKNLTLFRIIWLVNFLSSII